MNILIIFINIRYHSILSVCKKSRRFIELKYFYFEKNTERYNFPTKTEDGSYGLKMKREKCDFFKKHIQYLGHRAGYSK